MEEHTSQLALEYLLAARLRAAFLNAIQAAMQRSRELAQGG
jgi:pyrroline-5-carboxylate reductase